jgi:hypothetical protein
MEVCLGIILSAPICRISSLFMLWVIYACQKLQNFGSHSSEQLSLWVPAVASASICKSKNVPNWSCCSCSHCFSNTQAGHPLQFAKFSSACFEFDTRLPHIA